MILDSSNISSWDQKFKLRFINSLSGYKGAHLIGTINECNETNLAIFNSIVHISSEPPQIGFIIRPNTVKRDTYDNILLNEKFTINHVHKNFIEQAHYTSAKFDKDESEFKACNLKEQFLNGFKAPFVRESKIKIGLKLVEDLKIKSNGGRLIIGEIELIDIIDECVEQTGQLDLSKADDICVTGLNQYSIANKHKHLPYARVNELPDFKKKKRPDNIVFNEETNTYNASLLPYGTTISAPSIEVKNLSTWKQQNVSKFNHQLNTKLNELKSNFDRLADEYKINNILYQAKHDFEPTIGETYHLYKRDKNDELFLSLIPPTSWKTKHIGSYKLNSERIWEKA